MSDFWQYQFPPFFTIQPNIETRRLQLDAWNEIILDHCRRNRIFVLNVGNALTRPPFRNDSIDRALNEEALFTILTDMEKRGRIEWIHSDAASNSESTKSKLSKAKVEHSDQKANSCLVYWNKPEEWAATIRRWVDANGLVGSVCTFYEITDDDRADAALKKLDERMLLRACQLLEREGRASVMKMDNSYGVKFL